MPLFLINQTRYSFCHSGQQSRKKMATLHNLGFPRIGANRELKFALDKYWRKELDESALLADDWQYQTNCTDRRGCDHHRNIAIGYGVALGY